MKPNPHIHPHSILNRLKTKDYHSVVKNTFVGNSMNLVMGSSNNCVDKMRGRKSKKWPSLRGRAQKMAKLCPRSCCMTPISF